MLPENWKKIKAIFNDALDLDGAEREAFLASQSDAGDEILAEVEKMLAAESSHRLDSPIANVSGLWTTPEDLSGTDVGGFELLGEVGRGGMGVVYEAVRERDGFKQRAAVKLLPRGMDSDAMLRRFGRERKILASLEHPHIARLLDGGRSADGVSFFAMEFVEGLSLDDYCRVNECGLEARLELFIQACEAVSFAHSRLVVHRDLKPSNIMVTPDGVVKLLDFGIAKLISSSDREQTVTQFGMMTPAYASPEQIRGEIVTTATDIYSLGLILYELLTGRRAYHFANDRADEMARVICESEPRRPSTAARENFETNPQSQIRNPKSLRGDLDNIVLKALRKEPSRRYASVEAFMGDIRRFLDGQPVTARPDTMTYRLQKFVGRNRVAVVGASLVIVSLIVGIAATSWQAIRAERERAVAEERFKQVRELANNIVFKYYDEAEKLPNSTVLRSMFVKDSLDYFDSLARDPRSDEALRGELARAFLRIARVQGRPFSPNLGDTAGAVDNYRKGIAILEPLASTRKDATLAGELVTAYSDLAAALRQRGSADEANEALAHSTAIATEFLETFRGHRKLTHRIAANYLLLGDSLPLGTGDGESIAALQKARAGFESLIATAPDDLALTSYLNSTNERIANTLRIVAMNSNTPEASLDEPRRLLEGNLERAGRMRLLYPDNILAIALADAAEAQLGGLLVETGDFQRAGELLSKVEKVYRARLAEDAVSVGQKTELAFVRAKLGALYSRTNRAREADSAFVEALELAGKLIAQDAKNLDFLKLRAEFAFAYGGEVLRRGEIARARAIYQKAFDEIEPAARPLDAAYAGSLRGHLAAALADCDLAEGKSSIAADGYREAARLLKENGSRTIDGARFDGLKR